MAAMHTTRFHARTLIIAAALALGSACSEALDASEDTELEERDDAIAGDLATKTVTPNQPATLALRNGATLSIPRGALRKATKVRFEQARGRLARELIDALEERDPFTDQYEAVSAPYLLDPHDTNLLKAVSVSLPLARGARDSSLAVLWLEDENSRSWKELATVAARGDRATFPLHYFGVVILAKKKAAPPVDSGAYDAGGGDGGLPDAQGAEDATIPDAGEEDAGLSSCGASAPGVFVARVVDATTPTTSIPGVTVIVLDDMTGLPVAPSVQSVSSSEGCVRLSIGSLSRFGVRALGNANYIDSYIYHLGSALSEPLIRMSGNNVAALVPTLAQYEPRPDRAAVAGAVYWRTSDTPFYDVVGCAHIETGVGDAAAQDLRYFAANVPSSPTEWPLDKGTRPGDGRFFFGNVLAGSQTLTARLADGTVLGSTQLVVFPRSSGSTQVSGRPENLHFAPIYIEAPPGATKPGCAP